jgi:hypothetical protein
MAVRNTGIGAVSQDNQRDYPVTRSKIIKALQDLKDTKIFNALTSGQGLARQFQIDRQAPGSGLGTFQAGTTPGFYGAVSPTIESRPDKDSPLVSGTGIVSFDEAIDDPLQSMRELASLGLLQQSPTKATKTDDKSTTGSSTKSSKDKSATSTIDRKADLGVEEGSGLEQPDTAFDDFPTITDTTSQEDQSDSQETDTRSLGFGKLIESAKDEYLKIIGKDSKVAPKGARSIEEYKKEFSEATGIDISGEPDNRAALIALGTALMQNRAGKGFNVGEILSEVGRAGEKALPVFEAARKEAKEGQIAAGKFAIDARDRDKQARQDFVIQQRNYLTSRIDALRDKELARIQQIEDKDRAYIETVRLAKIEHNLEQQLVEQEALLEAMTNPNVTEYGSKFEQKVVDGTDLTVSMLPAKSGENAIYFVPEDAGRVGAAYVDVQKKLELVDELEQLYRDMQEAARGTPGGQAANMVINRAKRLGKVFGLGVDLSEISNERKAKAIIQSIISSSKRFLTQETGNGISASDLQQIRDELGEPKLLAPLEEEIAKLDLIRARFEPNSQNLLSQITSMQNRGRFASGANGDRVYEQFQNKLNNELKNYETLGNMLDQKPNDEGVYNTSDSGNKD